MFSNAAPGVGRFVSPSNRLSAFFPFFARPLFALGHAFVIFFAVLAALFEKLREGGRALSELVGEFGRNLGGSDLPRSVVPHLGPLQITVLSDDLQQAHVTRQLSLRHLVADFAAATGRGSKGFLPGSLALVPPCQVPVRVESLQGAARRELGLCPVVPDDDAVHCNKQANKQTIEQP